ncbi:MAG: cation diffusion facilitator family transporter [Candidatus Verstraetearchaeota archaeon]|nr:cation diffusion facilitator family transporter [Candidatus Verstraetearchaeota archaeon]
MSSRGRSYHHIKTEILALRISVAFLLAIGAVEILFGLSLGSIALIADGAHSLADSVVSVLVLVGISISRRRPDRIFSHGYKRAETLFGLLAAVAMMSLGGLMLYESYIALLEPVQIQDSMLAIAVAASAGISSAGLAVYKLGLARRSSSLAMKIDAYNSIKDGGASFVVVAGVWLSSLGFSYFDAVAGMAISFMIITVGYVSIKESSVVLLDGCLCPERLERIASIALRTEGVVGVRGVRLRSLGRSVAGQAVVELDGSLSVAEAHRISSEVKERIISEYGDISEMVIEIEPSGEKRSRSGSLQGHS